MALGAAALVFAGAVVARMPVGAPSMMTIGMIALTLLAVVAAWRWRVAAARRVERLDAALWAEAQAPALRYALVTLAEQERANDADPLQRRLASFTAAVGWEPAVQGALQRRRWQVAGRIATAVAVIALAHGQWPVRTAAAIGAPRLVARADSAAALPGRVQAEATLLPPAYTGRGERTLAFGETISALVGSVIRIDGAGDTTRATLLVQESSDSGAVRRAPSIVRHATTGGVASCGSGARRWLYDCAMPWASGGC